MNTTTKRLATLLVAVPMALTLTACMPKPSEENADRLASRTVRNLGWKYDLDQSQKDQLMAMYSDFRDDTALRMEYVALIDNWKQEIEKPAMDQDKVENLMRKRHELDMRSTTRVAEDLTELHQSLNDEQKQKVMKKLNKLRAWMSAGL